LGARPFFLLLFFIIFSTALLRKKILEQHAENFIIGFCRICFRELANEGMLPGVRKSSW
jgi:ribosomal protein S14